jgi:hypothetical protein
MDFEVKERCLLGGEEGPRWTVVPSKKMKKKKKPLARTTVVSG